MINNNIKSLSYSGIKKWKECPFKYKLHYVDNIVSFKGNEYTAFGSAIHKACEIGLLKKDTILYEVFKNQFEQEIEHLQNDEILLNDDLVKDMYQQAKNICKYVIPELNNYFKKFEIFSIEEEILEDIDDFENLKFKGYVDLILKTPDDRYHIIDWKTCSWGWNARKKADPLVNYQLTYYKNFISKKHNLNLSKIDTYFALLKRTAKTNHVEIFKVTSGSKKVENSLKILKNAAINIEKGFFIKNRLSCSKCEFYKTKYCK